MLRSLRCGWSYPPEAVGPVNDYFTSSLRFGEAEISKKFCAMMEPFFAKERASCFRAGQNGGNS